MLDPNKFKIRCRAVIIHEDKILVVKHAPKHLNVAIPGGHLESGEDPKSCLEREIIEELGIKPVIGNLLYVNSFPDENAWNIEFHFEVKNAMDYLDYATQKRTHSHELVEVFWMKKTDDVSLLPRQIREDFKNDLMDFKEVRFIRH